MSVYTKVTPEQLSCWLQGYAVGALQDMQGIAAGIENTNYFVTTERGRYVLTLFERMGERELAFYLNLRAHLARHDIPCPAPVARSDGALLGTLAGKPAALVTRLSGDPVQNPDTAHCEQVGRVLAAMHIAGLSFGVKLDNPRGPQWRRETAPQVLPFLDARRQQLLLSELEFQSQQEFNALPRGAVHADLFRDNVLFEQSDGALRIGGVIDFYFGGVDAFVFDLAVTVNDWCVHPDGGIDPPRAQALLSKYVARRPLSAAEHQAWPAMLRAAALRFWLSRLYDFYLPRPGELTHAHDPEHFRRILELRCAGACPVP